MYQNCISRQQLRLEVDMRDVWAKHVWWTREVIIGIIHNLPGLDLRVAKLLQNPAEMAAVFAPYISQSAQKQMIDLFTTHLKQGGDLVTAAKAGDAQKVAQITKDWYQNAEQIARFFADINPNYRFGEVRMMMFEHLRLTIAEATAELAGNYQESINTFDQIQNEAAAMADYFVAGLVK